MRYAGPRRAPCAHPRIVWESTMERLNGEAAAVERGTCLVCQARVERIIRLRPPGTTRRAG